MPEFGTVVDRQYTPAWIQFIPGHTSCSGNPPVCFTSPPQMIPWPDQWSVTVRDEKNPEWEGTVTDSTSATYDACQVGELWPVCWKGSR
ncbi:hypothetical protein PBI_BERNARDO_85 [Mycobacterium phage Bernardo]|uniref:Uncharacterized protein n=1 Tax=Mycobacterium phage Bernardo TaxID=1429903 RepID=V5R9L1_9CAUD|nr:hypothetical protein X818_gp085 [Mycobacterium phage Bernardo]AHB31762.1 hypothetical protein PBI_BERNARDO_85 [Mycobacterium phage Bernardo]